MPFQLGSPNSVTSSQPGTFQTTTNNQQAFSDEDAANIREQEQTAASESTTADTSLFGAAFRSSTNSIALASDFLTNPALLTSPPDSSFDVFGQIKADGMQDHFDELSSAQSAGEYQGRVSKIKQTEKDEQVLNQSPLAGSLLSMGVGAVDPAFLLLPEEAIPGKLGFLAKTLISQPVKFTALQYAEQQAKNRLDNTDTPFDTATALRNTAAATLTLGLLGKAAPFINAKGKAAVTDMANKFMDNRNTPIEEIDQPRSGFGPRSGGAAEVAPHITAEQRIEADAQTEQYDNAGTKFVKAMTPDSVTSPGLLGLNSESPAIRDATQSLFPNNNPTVGAKEGTTAAPVPADIEKQIFDGPLAPFARDIKSFAKQVSNIKDIAENNKEGLASELNNLGYNVTPEQVTPELVRANAQKLAIMHGENGTTSALPEINEMAKKFNSLVQKNYQDHLDQGAITHNPEAGRTPPEGTDEFKNLQALKEQHENTSRAIEDTEDPSYRMEMHEQLQDLDKQITRASAKYQDVQDAWNNTPKTRGQMIDGKFVPNPDQNLVEARDNGQAPHYWAWYMDRDKLNNARDGFISEVSSHLQNLSPDDAEKIWHPQDDMFPNTKTDGKMTADEARAMAHDIHDVMVTRVEEHNLTNNGEDPNGVSGPQMLRKLSRIPGYEGFRADRLMDLLPESIMRKYMKEGLDETSTHLIHSTSGRLALLKATGHDNVDSYIRDVMYPKHRQTLADIETTEKNPNVIKEKTEAQNKAYDDGQEIIKQIWNNVKGDVAKTYDAGPIGQNLRALTRTAVLGAAPLTFSAGGLATATLAHGFLPMVAHIINFADKATKTMTREELESWGVMTEMARYDMIRTASNSAGGYVPESDIQAGLRKPQTLGQKIQSPISTASSYINSRFSLMTGSNYLNDSFRSMNAQLAMKTVIEGTKKPWAELSPQEKTWLLQRTIDQSKLERIQAALAQPGSTFEGTGGSQIPKLSQWNDRVAAEAMRTAGMLDAYTSFHAINAGSLPHLFEQHKTLSQFKSFLPSMMNQFVVAGMQKSAAKFLASACLMIGFQAMNTRIREILGGQDPKKDRSGVLHDWFGMDSTKSQFANIATLAEHGLGRSALFGVPGDATKALYDFVDKAIVKHDFPTWLEQNAGPAVGEAKSLSDTAAQLYKHRKGQNWNNKDFNAATQALPGANMWGVKPYEFAGSLFGHNKFLDQASSQFIGGNSQVPVVGGPSQ